MENEIFYINCPYCNCLIEICEINCGIFRHAIYKHNGQQIDPHSQKEICNDLKKKDLILELKQMTPKY